MPKKILVVEDHAAYRETLIRTLNATRGVQVCGWSASGEEALEKLAEGGADLAVVDLSLPNMNGFELAAEIKKRFPKTHYVMLSGHSIQGYVERARSLGFQAYVLKGETAQLKSALRAVLAGKSYFPQFDE
jgi:DNA-binding NarL/FixJ family response regulator